jgi:uncharacterized protein involved in exopolysaccharide biosynthesis
MTAGMATAVWPRLSEMNQTTEPLFNRGFSLLLRHIRLFLLLTVSGGVAGFAITYLITPVFKADITLVPSDETLGTDQNSLLGGFSSIASLVGAGAGALGNKESEAIAILRSRALVWSYMQTNDLLPILFPNKWDPTAHKWKSDKKNYVPTLADGYTVFDKNIRNVVENRKTNVITVFITWRDPRLAKQWADGLVDAANDLLRRQQIERSTKNLDYLRGASEQTSIMEVKNSIYKLMESEIKKQMIAMGNKDYAFRVVDPAVVPERKVFPTRSYFAVFGAALGATIWFLLVAFRGRGSEPAQTR